MKLMRVLLDLAAPQKASPAVDAVMRILHHPDDMYVVPRGYTIEIMDREHAGTFGVGNMQSTKEMTPTQLRRVAAMLLREADRRDS